MSLLWLILQVAGLTAVVAGVFLLAGLGVSLIVGGVIVVGVSELRT